MLKTLDRVLDRMVDVARRFAVAMSEEDDPGCPSCGRSHAPSAEGAEIAPMAGSSDGVEPRARDELADPGVRDGANDGRPLVLEADARRGDAVCVA